MPQDSLRASATALPDDQHLRRRLAAAAERIIAVLDALDEADRIAKTATIKNGTMLISASATMMDISSSMSASRASSTIDHDQRKAWNAGRGFLTINGEV